MKKKLDELLVEREFFDTIEKARSSIMMGNIVVNEQKIEKRGTLIEVNENLKIRIKGDTCPYVSRGGYKLEKAIKVFGLDFMDKKVLDIGASTGGFTDCALKQGARFVYAVDVGTNQLDYNLRINQRVKSLEGKHIKDLEEKDLDGEKIDIIVADVSFISVTRIFEHLKKFCQENTELMILIKPQFETDKEFIDKGGIVKNIEKHYEAIEKIIQVASSNLFYINRIDLSPIKGVKGNVEYISLFKLNGRDSLDMGEIIKTLGGSYV
ncbi:MAG: TlyA family RNA methyltransferase [Fusobacteriaceae bacterium]